MYKVTNVTDKSGNVKEEFFDKMKSSNPGLTGTIFHLDLFRATMINAPLLFIWSDDSDKALRTSTVQDFYEDGDSIVVTTRNSIYYFTKIEVK